MAWLLYRNDYHYSLNYKVQEGDNLRNILNEKLYKNLWLTNISLLHLQRQINDCFCNRWTQCNRENVLTRLANKSGQTMIPLLQNTIHPGDQILIQNNKLTIQSNIPTRDYFIKNDLETLPKIWNKTEPHIQAKASPHTKQIIFFNIFLLCTISVIFFLRFSDRKIWKKRRLYTGIWFFITLPISSLTLVIPRKFNLYGDLGYSLYGKILELFTHGFRTVFNTNWVPQLYTNVRIFSDLGAFLLIRICSTIILLTIFNILRCRKKLFSLLAGILSLGILISFITTYKNITWGGYYESITNTKDELCQIEQKQKFGHNYYHDMLRQIYFKNTQTNTYKPVTTGFDSIFSRTYYNNYIKTNKWIFHQTTPIPQADLETFKPILRQETYDAQDFKHRYLQWKIVHTFKTQENKNPTAWLPLNLPSERTIVDNSIYYHNTHQPQRRQMI